MGRNYQIGRAGMRVWKGLVGKSFEERRGKEGNDENGSQKEWWERMTAEGA